MLDVHMAHAADDQGLALAGNHHSDPCGLFGPPSALQVFQGPDVVDLDVFVRAAELALVRQQSLLQVRPLVVPDGSRLIIENCIWTMLERHPLASPGLAPLLALALTRADRPPTAVCRGARADRHDGPRESALGQ